MSSDQNSNAEHSVSVVTGANSGIGRATAIHLAQQGHRVIGTVRSIEETDIRAATGVIILAIRRPDGSFVHQPSATTVTKVDDVLITLGTPDQQSGLQAWVGHPG